MGALGQKAAPAPSPRPGLHVGSPAPQLPRAAPRPAPQPAPPAPACSPRGAPVRPSVSVVRPLAAEEAGTFARSLPLGWLPPGRRPGPRGYIGRRLQSCPDTSDRGRPARRPANAAPPPARCSYSTQLPGGSGAFYWGAGGCRGVGKSVSTFIKRRRAGLQL